MAYKKIKQKIQKAKAKVKEAGGVVAAVKATIEEKKLQKYASGKIPAHKMVKPPKAKKKPKTKK